MRGRYYVVDTRFKRDPEIHGFIEVYRSEEVDPYTLTDADAGLAGVESGEAIKAFFRRWYRRRWDGGNLKMYRNWFRVI